jgi:hypothetical protein
MLPTVDLATTIPTDIPIRMDIGVRYPHTDAQGTIVAYTNASRQVLSRSAYDSWGGPRDHGNDDAPGSDDEACSAGPSAGPVRIRSCGVAVMIARIANWALRWPSGGARWDADRRA